MNRHLPNAAESAADMEMHDYNTESKATMEIDTWRGLLVVSVNDILSDVARVTDVSQHLPVLTSLDFLIQALNQFPELFIPSGSLQPVPSPEKPKETDAKDLQEMSPAYSLSCWVTSHLMRMLAVPGDTSVHAKAREVLANILQSTSSQNPFAFRHFVRLFLACLADLAKIYESFFDNNDNNRSNASSTPMTLNHYQLHAESIKTSTGDVLALTCRPIDIPNPDTCQQLQLNLTSVLSEITMSLSMFAFVEINFVNNSNDCAILWAIIDCQLECGEAELKTASLKLASRLLPFALPPPEALDYFLNCLVSLTELICCPPCGSNFHELEMALAETMEQILTTLGSEDFDVSARNSMLLVLVNNGIMQSLGNHGIGSLRTLNLRAALCRAVVDLIRSVGFQPDIHTDFLCRLVEEIGTPVGTELKQLFVGVFQEAIASELLGPLMSKLKLTGGSSLQSAEQVAVQNNVVAGREKKEDRSLAATLERLLVNSTGEALLKAGTNQSTIVIMVSQKLQKLLAKLEADPACSTADVIGLEILAETIARCSIFCHQSATSGDACMPTQTLANCASFRASQLIDLPRLIGAWFAYLVRMCGSEHRSALADGYGAIVRTIGSILFVQDVEALGVDELSQLVALLSLPWLVSEVSWMDLKAASFETRQLGTISKTVSDIAEIETIADSLYLLGLVPRHVAPRWRKQVLGKAVGDHREEIREAAVMALPNFLHSLGPTSNHLIKDVLLGLLPDTSVRVKESMAGILGILACVISVTSVLRHDQTFDPCLPSFRLIRIHCSFCHQSVKDRVSSATAAGTKTGDSATLLLPFLKSLSSVDSKRVKIQLIKQFERLFNHAWFWPGSSTVVSLVTDALNLILDSDGEVRMAFSTFAKFLVPPPSVDAARRANGVINAKLQTIDRMSGAHRIRAYASLDEAFLASIGEIASVADGDLVLSCMILLLNVLLFPVSPLLEAVALHQIKQLALRRRISLPQLYMQFGHKISESIVLCLYKTKSAKPNSDPALILQKVADVFTFDDVGTFLKTTEHLIVPHLLRLATPTASSLLKSISRLMDDPNHKNVIVRTIGHIFCHLTCSCDAEEMGKVLPFLESEMELPMVRLLRLGSHIDSLLLIHLSTSEVKVLSGLKVLLSAKGIIEGDLNLALSNQQLVSLLQPNLLGILVNFDKRLKDGTVPIADKRQVYKSLVLLMRMMSSSNITAVRIHIMTTLKIGLQFEDRQFAELCCEAWDCFVRSLEVSVLGPMLSQIVANLLPLLQQLPGKVAEIFRFLIVDRQSDLQEHLHELYFIPEIPELDSIRAVLRPFVDAVYSGRNLQRQIEHLLKGVSHESLDIRQMALSKLTKSVRSNRDVLHGMILSSETVLPIVSQMLSVLLNGCRESDPTTRSLFGKCLGEIGAIDPGRLELLIGQPKEEINRLISSMSDENFAYELINELSKTFLGAEDRTAQDCVAFALQELIRIYDIRSDSSDTASGSGTSSASTTGSRLWRRFSPDVQEILMPLTRSHYMLNFVLNPSSIVRPIYRTRKGTMFESWVCTLTSCLGTKLKQDAGLGRRVYEACRGVVKHGGDSRIALYILPHVMVQALLDGGSKERDMIAQEILAVLADVKDSDARHGLPTDLRHMTAQTVFSVLDHLTRWMRHRLTVLSLQSSSTTSSSDSKSSAAENDRSFRDIRAFLDCIPQDVLAAASYNCGAYMRSYMHYEQFVRKSYSSVPAESFDFLLKLYVALDEPDGVAGVVAIQQSAPSLAQQILAFESVGRLSDASVCYEHAIQAHPNDVWFRCGVLRNQLALGELNSALNLANGMIAENPAWSSELNTYRVEAAWRLGQWDKLKPYVDSDSSIGWSTGLGKLLLAGRFKDEAEFSNHLQLLRQEQIAPLSAASMEAGSYQRGYESIVRLHMLNELEEGLRVLMDFGSRSEADPENADRVDFAELFGHWRARLQCCQLSYRYQDPILNLRRIILQLAKDERSLGIDPEIGQCWLQSAKVARECGLIQTAHSSLLSAADYKLPEFCMEKAKWLWDKGDFDHAQSCLEKAIEDAYPSASRAKFKLTPVSAVKEPELSERLTCARMLLQLGRYCDEMASWESSAVVRQLKEVTQVHGEWEDGYFYVASYYDKVMMACIDRPEKRGDFITQVVQYFGLSLLYGTQYIYQSMPRMLTLWLDYGAEVVAAETGEKTAEAVRQGMRASLSQLNRHIAQYGEKLAPYQFFVAFPQLISRICHAHPDVFVQLKTIIAGMLKEFPQQSVWMMMAVSKSSYPMRVKRCQEIFGHARALRPDLSKFLADMTKITDKLLDLCNRQVENMTTTTLSIATHFKPLQRLLDDKDLSPILLPLQSQMTPTLPAMPVAPSSHVPFPSSIIYLHTIEDTVDVLASLQRPKKITLVGSDGRRYALLCKPKDDLRKDARLMEFNGIVNRCLLRDAESRRRNLRIRTFTVTALNEECGLLEWVSNTSGLRPILLKLYKKLGLYMSGKELKSLQLPPNSPVDKKLAIYRTKLLPRHPAVFSEWFLQTFPDPTSWYNARLSYCRTAAVMSMVGYILGLGDRHGENILLDSTTGDCVHVDFNCLFNKGETFDYPEIVPFRLTHNMIEAMGLLGFEGVFRRSCEVTMRVMRDQMDPLMSVLKTFIYDPLVEWSKPVKGRSNPTESGEIRNEKAQTHVSIIEDRLRGILKNKTKSSRGLPLSVEGHVNHLIKEATDDTNLCQMYIGWAAYM